ncbi:protein of unknown function [Burkholderia multivorans]
MERAREGLGLGSQRDPLARHSRVVPAGRQDPRLRRPARPHPPERRRTRRAARARYRARAARACARQLRRCVASAAARDVAARPRQSTAADARSGRPPADAALRSDRRNRGRRDRRRHRRARRLRSARGDSAVGQARRRDAREQGHRLHLHASVRRRAPPGPAEPPAGPAAALREGDRPARRHAARLRRHQRATPQDRAALTAPVARVRGGRDRALSHLAHSPRADADRPAFGLAHPAHLGRSSRQLSQPVRRQQMGCYRRGRAASNLSHLEGGNDISASPSSASPTENETVAPS